MHFYFLKIKLKLNGDFSENDWLFSPDAREKPHLVLKNETSFGKVAGKWIVENAQAVRF